MLNPSNLFKILYSRFGNLNWWPIDKNYHKKNTSDPRFEIIIGTILTQNTNWSNVQKALENLKSKKLLDIKKISNFHVEDIQEIIRPAGFFKQKAKRLKNIAYYINLNYKNDLDYFFNRNLFEIRNELLSMDGIGPETADSILLYAGNFPIFVVDSYTKRICKRIPITNIFTYDNIQKWLSYVIHEFSPLGKSNKLISSFLICAFNFLTVSLRVFSSCLRDCILLRLRKLAIRALAASQGERGYFCKRGSASLAKIPPPVVCMTCS